MKLIILLFIAVNIATRSIQNKLRYYMAKSCKNRTFNALSIKNLPHMPKFIPVSKQIVQPELIEQKALLIPHTIEWKKQAKNLYAEQISDQMNTNITSSKKFWFKKKLLFYIKKECIIVMQNNHR